MRFRYFLLCFTIICFSIRIQAQTYFGIKGTYALSFTKSEVVKYDDVQDFLLYQITLKDQDVLPSVSAYIYYRNDPIYLQAELSFRRTEINFAVIDVLMPDDLRPRNRTKRTDKILVPIHAGLQYQNLKFGGGPIVSYIINENEVFEALDHFEERRQTVEIGFSINFGLVIRRLELDISYEMHLDGTADYFYFRETKKGFIQDNRLVKLGLGFLF